MTQTNQIKIQKYKVANTEVLVKTSNDRYYTAYEPNNEYCCKSFGQIMRNDRLEEVNGGLSTEDAVRIIAEKINNVAPNTYKNEEVFKVD